MNEKHTLSTTLRLMSQTTCKTQTETMHPKFVAPSRYIFKYKTHLRMTGSGIVNRPSLTAVAVAIGTVEITGVISDEGGGGGGGFASDCKAVYGGGK